MQHAGESGVQHAGESGVQHAGGSGVQHAGGSGVQYSVGWCEKEAYGDQAAAASNQGQTEVT